MKRNKWDDAKMASAVGLDRSQVSRIRRGLSGTTKDVGLKLQEITRIPWHQFIEPDASPQAGERRATA